MDREKIALTVRKLIADRNAHSVVERESVYAAARSALDRSAGNDPVAMMELESVIADIESSYRPTPQAPAAPPVTVPPGGGGRTLARAAIDALVGALVAAVIVAAALPLLARDDEAVGKLKYQYENALPQVPVAIDFLHKVADAVRKMQKEDRAGIEAKASKRFIGLGAFDPELPKQQPSSLPPGSSIILKADGDDYKILFNWTLCGTVRIENPEMVDPIRNRADVPGCPYFGVWTAGAAKW